MAKRILAMMVILVFALGIISLAFASGEVTGKITKIEGNKLTIKAADGKETTVEVKSAKGLKVGDEVTIKDGVATKVTKKKKAIEGC
jgi:outer membrane lipoprotein SlyB